MNEVSKLNIKLIHEDSRGQIFAIENNGKEIASIETYTKDAPRGGHFHPFPEDKIVFTGSINYHLLDPKTKKEAIALLKTGDRIVVPPNHPHMFVGVDEHSAFFVIKTPDSENYKATYYAPYRKKIDEFLKSKN